MFFPVLPAARRLASAALIALAAFAAACGDPIDGLLEEKVEPDVHLSMALESKALTITQGKTATLSASITRLGDYHGNVAFTLTGLPEGVTSEIGTPVTAGQVTTALITFHVSTDAVPALYGVTIKGSGGNGKAMVAVTVEVAPIPAIDVALSSHSITIVQGGIAPLGVVITRVRAPDPVTLVLAGPSGITSSVAAAITESSADVTISVAAGVAAGSYAMTLRASTPGVTDRVVPVTVIVSADPLQLVVKDAATTQASIVSSDVIVNRNGVNAALTFAADDLPASVTASFQGGAAGASTAKATFTVGASTPAGTYAVTLRGVSSGATVASTTLRLKVDPSSVAFTLAPQSATIVQGTSAVFALTLVRTAFSGGVTIQSSGAPIGLSVTPADPVMTGSSTVLTVAVGASVTPGVYPLTVRAIPAASGGSNGPALDPVTATLTITVRDSHQVGGTLILDWSACAAPQWVAVQDGTGVWNKVSAVNGVYSAAIITTRGGFAYVLGNGSLSIRYGLTTELTAAPLSMCPVAAPATKSVTGTAEHSAAGEEFTWLLGGGSGLSTTAAPDFTINGVREGTFDLMGTGTTQQAYRYYLGRDVNIAAGGSVGGVGLTGTNSFAPVTAPISFNGLVAEAGLYTTSYLSGSACTPSVLREVSFNTGTGAITATVYGVPAARQRPDDYHLFDVIAYAGNRVRSVSTSFHTMSSRTIPLPTAITPTVTALASGGHKRLRASFSAVLPANYNETLTLSYTDGARAVTVTASLGYLGTASSLLDTPDLSGVNGFPAATVIQPTASVSWSVAAAGSTGQPLCAESTRWSSSWKGTL